MNWFRSKHKKRSPSKAKRQWKRAQTPRPRRDLTAVWAWMRRLSWAAVFFGMIAGAYYGYDRMRQQVVRIGAALPQVELVDAPGWMGPQRAERIRQSVASVISPDPLDQASLAAAAALLADSPWIEAVERVKRGYDGRIEVHAVYRTPVALVEARDGYHLVDAHGRRLPGIYPLGQVDSLNLPSIRHVRAAPPAEGQVWPGEDLQAGLRLAMFMGLTEFADVLDVVDVANYDGRVDRRAAHLVLRTDHGAVEWGRAPGQEGVIEPGADHKLAMLRRIASRYPGQPDAGGKVVSVVSEAPSIRPAADVRYTSGQ